MERVNLRNVKIAEITPETRKFSVTFKVLEVMDEKSIVSRRDGMEHRVADVLVGDESGVALLTAWDNEIDKFRELIGETVSLVNGYVSLYRGSLRLGLGRFGSIAQPDRKIEEVNLENNISERKYEEGRRERRDFRRRPKRF